MNSAAILQQLERLTPGAPRAALEAAMKQKETLTPELMAVLARVTGNMATVVEDPGFVLHLHALFLLAQFRERTALQPALRFFARLSDAADVADDEVVYVLDESGARILASLSHGEMEPLLQVAEDEDLNDYLRSISLDAIALMAAWGQMTREKAIAGYREMFHSRLARPGNSLVWFSLVSAALDINAQELLPEIREAFQAGLVEEVDITLDFVKDGFAERGAALTRELAREKPPISNAIDEFEGWLRFRRRIRNYNIPVLLDSTVKLSFEPGQNPPNN